MPTMAHDSVPPDQRLLMGRIGKTHGVVGAVKVIPETDDPQRFASLETVFIGPTPDEAVPHRVESVRFQPTKRGIVVVLKLLGFDSMQAASSLRGRSVYAFEDDLPPLGEDEFFYHDLMGMEVWTNENTRVGLVSDVLELPAHPVLVVARPDQPDVLIPVVPAFMVEVDLESGRIVVQPIEGLLD